jgi:hypothetical protein
MVMNNVSFQDMFIMGYETNSGGENKLLSAEFSPSNWGNLLDCDGVEDTTFWSSDSGGTTSVESAKTITFTVLNGTLQLQLIYTATVGVFRTIRYIKNSEAEATYTGPITINNGDTLKIGIRTGAGDNIDSGSISVNDLTRELVLDVINYTAFNETYTLTPSDWGNADSQTSGGVLWSSSSGTQTNINNANNVVFTLLNTGIELELSVVENGTPLATPKIRYSKNSASAAVYTTGVPISISNGNSLKLAVNAPTALDTWGNGTLTVTDITNNRVVDVINYSFSN